MKKLFAFLAAFIMLSMPTVFATDVSGNISGNITWNLAGSPYIVTSSITIDYGARLTILPGVTVKFDNSRYLYVNGELNAKKTTFTSNNGSPAPGDWGYIQVGNGSNNGKLILDSCQVLYASQIYVYHGSAALSNTDLTNFSSHGVNVEAPGNLSMTKGIITTNSSWAGSNGSGILANANSRLILSGVNIQHFQHGLQLNSNAEVNISDIIVTNCNWPLTYNSSADLTTSGVNSFVGNTNTAVNMNFSSIADTISLPVINIPFIFSSGMTVNEGARMAVGSNNIIKFPDYNSLNVYGSLIAVANPGENIYFTSLKDDSWGGDSNGDGNSTSPSINNWYGIHFYNSSIDANCNLNGCKIKYAGYGNTGGLNFENASPTISNCEITDSFSGIFIQTGGSPIISNITINSCTYPYYYTAEGNVKLSGTDTYTDNTYNYALLNFSQVYNLLGLPTITIPYVINQNMNVNENAQLLIGSGNIIKVNEWQFIDIYGTLVADANPGENIFFTSIKDDNWGGDTNGDAITTAPSSGNWYGIRFQNTSDDAHCVMRRCLVRFAGAGNIGGINMYDASPTIDSCDISNNYFGVYMQYASNPVFTNNTVGSSQMTPIAMSFEANPTMSNNTLSFSDNAYDAIGLLGGTLTANANLKIRSVTTIPNITYLMLDQITIPVGKSLTINKGIVIKSYTDNSYYYPRRIIVEGTLIANATADSMIVFTSARDDNYGNPVDCNKDGTITSPVIGNWDGIIFNGGGGTLNYCRIKYARAYNYGFATCSTTEYVNESAVAMIDASPTISNCEFKDLTYGISCYRASNPIISSNSMINIQYTPFCISGSSNPVFSNITFTNVGWRAIGLLGGNVCLNGTIKKRDVAGFTNITYVLLANMTINSGTYVNIEAGVVIKVNNANSYNQCSIFIDGGFKTDGTTGQGVVFTSMKDDNAGNPLDSNGDGNASTPAAGDWGSIKYRATSNDVYCLLNYTTVKYAGNTAEGGVSFENAGSQLRNSTISNTSNYGVYTNGNSTPIIDQVVIQNCSLDPIAMSLTSNPVFSNITLTSNFSQAIKIIEGTLSSNATLETRNVAGITNIAYIVSNLVISSNSKLTIQPGVVIKFRADNGCLYPRDIPPTIVVNGNLISNGTLSNKIYFTSFADDSKGGDSNNNGNTTTPTKGDWGNTSWYCDRIPGGINFINNSINADTVNTLKNCEFSYADIVFRFENSHASIEDCIIQQCNYGASIIGSSNPLFIDCQFYNITNSPVELSMFSKPVFTNCTALNVGYMALSVIPETYSQTDTVPIRNFGGYDNINYFMEGACTINSGTTITIPAGIVFKSSSTSYGYTEAKGFIVNGRLNIQGTLENPVIFTNSKDDGYGNPKDMNQDGSASVPPEAFSYYYYGGPSPQWFGNWITFNDVSDDLSLISNVVFKYGDKGISTLSASPTIDSVRFENLYCGVDMNGVSAPKIDYCTFNNLQYYPIQISLVSYPASTHNNTISGTTYKVIKVRDETLTQDVTLPKRDFGGVINIPYYFENYTIGTSAALTINPGIVCKFSKYGKLDIFKGLSAIGGATPESNIVFTSIEDDFYGGDSNSDGKSTSAVRGDWDGLIFEDQSLDPLCKLKNCIIRFADKGIKTTSASLTVENCNINNNNYGVYATAASNPVFTNCDFDDNYYFAIDNVDKSFVINAENCWWGSNLGPIQTNNPGDGTSIQELVTDAVDYTPWKTTGAGNPLMGDVSLNGMIQAYDAALILQNVVGSITLISAQQTVADVSAASGITAYDASLILQYVVGLNQSFPAELKTAHLSALTYPQLIVGSANAVKGQTVNIPLSVTNVSGMVSAEIKLQYNPAYLRVNLVTKVVSEMNMVYSNDSIKGILTIAMAGSNPLNLDTILAQVTFHTLLSSGNETSNALIINKFIANETDMTSGVINGMVTITNYATGIATNIQDVPKGVLSVYPNPSFGNVMLSYQLNVDNRKVIIEVFNLMGQKVVTLVNEPKAKGKYLVPIINQGNSLDCGSYIIRMTMDNFSQSQKFLIVR